MKALVFGASGMIGQGVVRECLLDSRVTNVTVVTRAPIGQHHDKLTEIVIPDLGNLSAVEDRLRGFDACFFSLGISAVGLTEAAYSRVVYDLTVGIATTLARLNPGMTFIYVSGQGTDSSEHGRIMWARVKGRTENALLKLPFKATYMFRAGLIIPLHGIRSKTSWYNSVYAILRPIYQGLHWLLPRSITTTEQIGRAMIGVAEHGYRKPILDAADIGRI